MHRPIGSAFSFVRNAKIPDNRETVRDSNLAEGVGFEPTIRYNRIPDFESGAFDHSAISPHSERVILTEQDPFCFFAL